jgi:hypothetical protein
MCQLADSGALWLSKRLAGNEDRAARKKCYDEIFGAAVTAIGSEPVAKLGADCGLYTDLTSQQFESWCSGSADGASTPKDPGNSTAAERRCHIH